jgi:hypothetical protein
MIWKATGHIVSGTEFCGTLGQIFFKSSIYFTHQHVSNSKLYVVLTLRLCDVWISEQTLSFGLYSINRLVLCRRGGECLLRGMN